MAYPSDSECDPAGCVLLNRLADPLILEHDLVVLWSVGTPVICAVVPKGSSILQMEIRDAGKSGKADAGHIPRYRVIIHHIGGQKVRRLRRQSEKTLVSRRCISRSVNPPSRLPVARLRVAHVGPS
jgi:hypothetical protein